MKMTQMLSRLVILVLFLQIYAASYATDKKFDIIQNGKSIGTATFSEATDTKLQTTSYTFQCDYTMNIGVEIVVSDYMLSTFGKDTLQSSKVVSRLNGKERFSVEQTLTEDKTYKRTVNKKAIAMAQSPVIHSYIQLFSKMPLPATKVVFSEYYGKNMELKKIGENTFFLGANGGTKTTFYYDAKGEIKKINVVSSVGTYDMIPVRP